MHIGIKSLIASAGQDKLKTPTVVFHGFSMHCKGVHEGEFLANHIKEVTGAHAECVEIMADFEEPEKAADASMYSNFVKYTEAACEAVRKSPNFGQNTEFNLVGISQGSLVARNLVENCPDLKVRNLFTIGGPHRGTYALEHCIENTDECNSLRAAQNNLGYIDPAFQENLTYASYWRDPTNVGAYLEHSIFLPYLNNEKDFSEQRKQQMLKLNHAIFVMNNQDCTVFPKESAVFGELQADLSVLPREETELWKKDLLGLRQATEEGRFEWIVKEGAHVEFTYEWFDEHILPSFQS